MYIRQMLFVAFAGLAATSPAVASSSDPATHIVRYSDLDLSNAAGRTTLDRRINHAVRMVCGRASSAAIQDQLKIQKCNAIARASAKAQLAEKG
jgi:UrcA family protein